MWRYPEELQAAKAREAALANNVTDAAPPAPAVGEGARVEDLVLTSVSEDQARSHSLLRDPI